MAWNKQVPMVKMGLQHLPYTFEDGFKWVDAEMFKASLRFDSFRRGRSAAYSIWICEDGKEWPMFLKDLGDAIPSIDHGKLVGLFTFVKRGKNYGIALDTPD